MSDRRVKAKIRVFGITPLSESSGPEGEKFECVDLVDVDGGGKIRY